MRGNSLLPCLHDPVEVAVSGPELLLNLDLAAQILVPRAKFVGISRIKKHGHAVPATRVLTKLVHGRVYLTERMRQGLHPLP